MGMDKNYFDGILMASLNSKVYKNFCKELYGTDLIQYNMVTASQLETLEKVCAFQEGQTLVDLGCGAGDITERLSQKYSLKSLGIDFSEQTVKEASERTKTSANIQFQVHDIFNLPKNLGTFDVVLSMDTIYFTQDKKRALENWVKLCKPGSKFVLFFTQVVNDSENQWKLESHSTDLALGLKELNLTYESWDFSEDEYQLWSKAKHLLEQYKEPLSQEGNLDVYKGWTDALEMMMPCWEEKRISRYLYSVVV